jgi:hypothetical protein
LPGMLAQVRLHGLRESGIIRDQDDARTSHIAPFVPGTPAATTTAEVVLRKVSAVNFPEQTWDRNRGLSSECRFTKAFRRSVSNSKISR